MIADWVFKDELPSDEEIDRRYRLVRAKMAAAGYRSLVVAGRAGALEAGYLRYFSGWRLWFGTGYVVFPDQADPTLILAKRSQTYWARQQSWLGDVIFAESPAEKVAALVQTLGVDAVGFAGLDRIATPSDVSLFQESTKQSALLDATTLVQGVMARKSAEEKRLQRVGVERVAAGLRRFAEVVRPGLSEREAVAQAVATVTEGGCTDGIAHISNQAPPYIHPSSNRMITREDTLKFSMEWAGPAGYWIELSGVYSFKPPSPSDQALFDVTRRAFDLVGGLLKPGARVDAVATEAERVFEESGFKGTGMAVEHAHGIGLNVIEPPLVVATESAVLAEGMVISVHPGVLVGDGGSGQRGIYIQDNFEVSAEGGLRQSSIDHKWNIVG